MPGSLDGSHAQNLLTTLQKNKAVWHSLEIDHNLVQLNCTLQVMVE